MLIRDLQENNIECLQGLVSNESYEVSTSELFWSSENNHGFKVFEIEDQEDSIEVWIIFIEDKEMYMEAFDTQINKMNELSEIEICYDEKLNYKANEYFLEKLSEF